MYSLIKKIGGYCKNIFKSKDSSFIIKNPWAGLSSYEDPLNVTEPLKFYGREDESLDLFCLIDDNIVVTLYGKSGIGKTSLLNAGVFPILRKNYYAPLYVRFGTDSFDERTFAMHIIEILTKQIISIYGENSIDIIDIVPENNNPESEDYLWCYFARRKFSDKKNNPIFPVIVFDQFEESIKNQKDQAILLLKQIVYLSNRQNMLKDTDINGKFYRYDFNFRFVISIREDDLFQLEDVINSNYLTCLKTSRYRLHNLTENGAKEIVICNGQECIDKNCIDVISNRIIEAAKTNGNLISTNVLSLICSRLYDLVRRNGRYIITETDVKEYLENNPFEEYYSNAIKDLTEREKIFIEKNLVTSDGRRNIISENELNINIKSPKHLFDGDTKILHRIQSEDKKNQKVELLHDGLCKVVHQHKSERIENQKETIYRLWLLLFGIIGILIIDQSIIQDIASFAAFDPKTTLLKSLLSDGHLIGLAELIGLLIVPLAVGTPVFSLPYRKKISYLLFAIYIFPIILCFKFFHLGLISFCQYIKEFQFFSAIIHLSDKEKGFIEYTIIILFLSIWNFFGQNAEKTKNSSLISLLTNRSTIIYFWVIAVILFLFSIFGSIEGSIISREDSVWGLIVIPFLTLFLFDFDFSSKARWLVFFLILLVVYAITVYLNLYLTYQFVIVFLVISSFVLIKCYFKGKLLIAINKCLFNIFVLLGVLIVNFGYNFNVINSKDIIKVFPWKLVYFTTNDKVGELNAIRGDTLLIPEFSINSYSLSSNKSFLKQLSVYKYNTLIHYSFYPFDLDSLSILHYPYNIHQIIKRENGIYHNLYPKATIYDNLLSKIAFSDQSNVKDDSEKMAAKIFFKIRNNIVYYIITDDDNYLQSDLEPLEEYSKILLMDLSRSIDGLKNNASCLSEPLVTDFTRTLTKCIYINILTTALIKNQYEYYYTLFSTFYLLTTLPNALPYQQFLSPAPWEFDNGDDLQLQVNQAGEKKQFKFNDNYTLYFDWRGVMDNKLYAINDLFDIFFNLEYKERAGEFGKSIEEHVEHIQKISDKIANKQQQLIESFIKHNNELSKLPFNASSLNSEEEKEIAINRIKQYFKQDSINSMKKNLFATVNSYTSYSDSILTSLKDLELLNIDLRYGKLFIEINRALISIVKMNPNNPYSGYLKSICEKIYTIGVVRGYDMKEFTKGIKELSDNIITPKFSHIIVTQEALDTFNNNFRNFQSKEAKRNREIKQEIASQ